MNQPMVAELVQHAGNRSTHPSPRNGGEVGYLQQGGAVFSPGDGNGMRHGVIGSRRETGGDTNCIQPGRCVQQRGIGQRRFAVRDGAGLVES